MKKFTPFLLFAFIMIVSCEKASVKDCFPKDAISLNDALTVKEGKFNFTSEESAGVAKIYLQKNGRYVVGLEKMNLVEAAEFEVHLSAISSPSPASFSLFSAKSIQGEKYYMLPENFVLMGYNFVLIQNDRSESAIASAPLD